MREKIVGQIVPTQCSPAAAHELREDALRRGIGLDVGDVPLPLLVGGLCWVNIRGGGTRPETGTGTKQQWRATGVASPLIHRQWKARDRRWCSRCSDRFGEITSAHLVTDPKDSGRQDNPGNGQRTNGPTNQTNEPNET